MKKYKLVVFAIHRPNRAPNERYRWYQFYPHIQGKYEIEYLYLLNESDDYILFYSKNYLLKLSVFIKTFIKRTQQILSLKNADVIIIYRELHWLHFPYWIKKIKKKTQTLIFDFDDAIFLKTANPLTHLIKQPYSKTIHFIQNADIVITGNNYLKDFSLKHNTHTITIPTVVDTDYFVPLHHLRHQENQLIIGWMGSHSTLAHLLSITDVLKEIKKKYPFVEYKIIAKKMFIHELNLYSENWDKDKEIEALNTFDIGIMPLPNDEWSKGKCGLKILSYLSCEIPCIANNIGANIEIIEKTNGGILVNDKND